MSTAEQLTDWADGPPPCEGWWNASYGSNPNSRRHWDGKQWSLCVIVGEPDHMVELALHDRVLPSRTQPIRWRGLIRPRTSE